MATNAKSTSILPMASSDPPPKGEEKLFKGSAMTKRGAYAAISYMTCAVLLVLFNKAALSSYSFPCANVITLCQIMCSCFLLYVLRRWKVISFHANEFVAVSDNSKMLVSIRTLIHTSPLALTYLLYMLVTMESVRGVNVPMYTTLRRTTVVFTMIVEYLLVSQRYTRPVIGSVALIVLGAFIAGARDLSFDAYGYLIVFLSNFTTAIYLATIARVGIAPSTAALYVFLVASIVVCHSEIVFAQGNPVGSIALASCGAMGLSVVLFYCYGPFTEVVILLSCILAFFLNYSIFLNTTLNSALTQTICGNLKDLFTISLGWVIFGGLPFDLLNVIGQLLGFIGSGLYAYYKLIGK